MFTLTWIVRGVIGVICEDTCTKWFHSFWVEALIFLGAMAADQILIMLLKLTVR